MRPLSEKLRLDFTADPNYAFCALRDGQCSSKVEWHHVFTYAGRQINERWAIVPACQYHHRNVSKYGDCFKLVALLRATDEELAKYPKFDFPALRFSLMMRYQNRTFIRPGILES